MTSGKRGLVETEVAVQREIASEGERAKTINLMIPAERVEGGIVAMMTDRDARTVLLMFTVVQTKEVEIVKRRGLAIATRIETGM